MLFRGEWASAIAALNDAIREFQELPEPYNALGIAFLEQGRFTEAVNYFREASGRAPDWAFPWHNLAITYVEQGNFHEAEQTYQTAIKHAPHRPYLHYNLGLLYQRLYRLSEADERYEDALGVCARQREKYLAIASDWQGSGEARAADEVKLAQLRAGAYDGIRAQIYNTMGTLAERRKNLRRAERSYQLALKIDHVLLAARHNLASLYFDNYPRRLNDAVREWRENLRINDRHGPTRLGLARAYRRQGRLREAEDEYRTLLLQDPDHPVAKRELTELSEATPK
jgi:tetratricopeptide (TPR) repeat protein